jgi:hypothetical protein
MSLNKEAVLDRGLSGDAVFMVDWVNVGLLGVDACLARLLWSSSFVTSSSATRFSPRVLEAANGAVINLGSLELVMDAVEGAPLLSERISAACSRYKRMTALQSSEASADVR